jgi:hypothetical protein
MVNSKSIHNVMRLAVDAEKDIQPTMAPTESSYVVYFYYAPEDKAIDFKNIERDLKNSAKSKALVEKLQSTAGDGVTKYSAGYFSWKRVIVVTNKYDQSKKKFIVYQANVDSMGTIVPGSEKIIPESNYPSPDQIKEEFNIFKNGVLNLQTGTPGQYEVYYFNGEPQDDIAKRLLVNPKQATQGEQYNVFSKKLDQFRIWTTNGLMRPDFRKSNTDGVRGGYYPGGEEAFNTMIMPLVPKDTVTTPQKPQEPSLGQKQEQKEDSRFEPATRNTEPVKGDYLDTPSQGARMANNKKSAQNVVLAYLKNSSYSTVAPATGQYTAPGAKKSPTVPVSNIPEENENSAKVLQDYAKDQRKMDQKRQQLQQSIAQRAQSMTH